MRLKKKWEMVILIISSLLLLSSESNSIPPIACEFYGNATINNTQAAIGTNITAYDSDGVLCGSFTVVNQGYFGLLSCKGDDPDTSVDEGAVSSENITFYINGDPTRRFFNYTWYQGSLNLVYLDVNQPPSLIIEAAINATEDVYFFYDVDAYDPNNDQLFFYDNSTIFDIDVQTGYISFTPTNDDVGFYHINITVRDAFGLEDSQVINFTITNVNDAPFFLHTLEKQTVYARETLLYDINASDIDRYDTITFFDNSTKFNISPTTGLINWTTTDDDIGNYTVNITVCDDSGALDNCTSGLLDIEVLFSNHPPVLSYIGPQKGYVNLLFELNVTAIDEDNDTLFFSDNSTMFNITKIDDSTALVSFTPALGDLGTHLVIIGVGDNYTNDTELVEFAILPELFCGDGQCTDFIGETCFTCPEDCGECPPGELKNVSGEVGGGAGVPGEQYEFEEEGLEGLEGAEGVEGGVPGIIIKQKEKGVGGGVAKLREIICKQEWECGEWGPCVNGFQNRTCWDRNNCTYLRERYENRGIATVKIIESPKPEEIRACGIIPTCFDGIQNQGEEGIDCGGPCSPCGIRAIPRYARLPFIERPTVPGCGNGICSHGEECACMRDCRIFPWQLFIILTTILTALFTLSRIYLFLLYKKGVLKKWRYLIRARRVNLAALFAFLITLIICLYIFLYSSCDFVFRRLLWVPILFILIAPILTYMLLLKFGYLESRKRRKLQKAISTHHEQMKHIQRIEEELIMERQEDVSRDILRHIQEKPEGLLKVMPRLAEVYHDLRALAKARANKADASDAELSLCRHLLSITKAEDFKELLKHDSKAQRIYEELELIFSHLRQKQKIRMKIIELEKELQST